MSAVYEWFVRKSPASMRSTTLIKYPSGFAAQLIFNLAVPNYLSNSWPGETLWVCMMCRLINIELIFVMTTDKWWSKVVICWIYYYFHLRSCINTMGDYIPQNRDSFDVILEKFFFLCKCRGVSNSVEIQDSCSTRAQVIGADSRYWLASWWRGRLSESL